MRATSVTPVRRASVLRVIAPFTLALGYLDLARGGVSAGPVLLVLGYLVLVPAAMLES